MNIRNHPWPVLLIWAFLVFELVSSLISERWSVAFVALATLGLTIAPRLLAERLELRLPVPFVVAIVAFVFATLFLGEVLDFYNRYWWWDVVLHGASAITFGMVGFLFVFYLFEGDRYAAPPWALALIAFCIAVMIGVVWEIFEYTMDQVFGMNMQKSGLQDTMWDLIVDVIGGALGASSGWLYLGGHREGWPARAIDQFVRMNRSLFKKSR